MKRSDVVARIVVGSLVTLAAACGGGLPTEVSDTGYQGTWQRGNERVRSTLSIVEVDGEYLIRWDLNSDDGKWRVVGGWDGKAEEFVDGEKTSEYVLRAWIDPDSGHLRVEMNGRVERPTPLDVHSVDELVVIKKRKKRRRTATDSDKEAQEGAADDDAREIVLRSYVLEDVNRTYGFKEGPWRDLTKISDDVADPPDGWIPPSRRGGNPRP